MNQNQKNKKPFKVGYSPLLIIGSFIVFLFFALFKGDLNFLQSENSDNYTGFFYDRTEFLADNPEQNTTGLTLFDYNFEGLEEILVLNYDQDNLVLTWDSEKFKNIGDNTIKVDSKKGVAAVACDFDADGIEELFISTGDIKDNVKHKDYLYDFVDGSWKDILVSPFINEEDFTTNGRGVTCLDRNGDGFYEIAQIDKFNGVKYLEYSAQQKIVVNIADQIGFTIKPTSDEIIAIPLYGKLTDLILVNNNLTNEFYKNNGNGTFSSFDLGNDFKNVALNNFTMNYLDINGDLLLDVVIGSDKSTHKLLNQLPNSTFVNVSSEKFAEPSDIKSVLISDFDLNGIQDIFMVNNKQDNKLLAGFPIGFDSIDIGSAREKVFPKSTGLSYDLDGDNLIELLLGHSESYPLKLYKPYDTLSNFLKVKVLTKQGAPARGAIVKLTYERGTQIQVVGSSAGRFSYSGTTVQFGISQFKSIKSIEVIFPDGYTLNVANPEINKTLEVKRT